MSPRTHLPFAVRTFLLSLALFVPVFMAPAPAPAVITHPFLSSFGSFSNPQDVAVDQSTGDVYVIDVGTNTVYKFDSSGNPVNFSTLGTNALNGQSGADATPQGGFSFDSNSAAQVAIDSSPGVTNGDIYVTDSLDGFVDVFNSTGAYLGQLTGSGGTGELWGEPCGVAVDSAGGVYVGIFQGNVDKFTPLANPVVDAGYVSSLQGIGSTCKVASGSFGIVYTEGWSGGTGPVTKYAPAQFFTPPNTGTSIGTVLDPNNVGSVAADSLSGDLFMDEGSDIAQYSSTGSLIDTFATQGSPSYGIAVNASTAVPSATGDVYVSDPGRGTVDIFGPLVVLADVSTSAASGVASTTATLNGMVNPNAVQVTACQFEYGTGTSYANPPVPCMQTPAQIGNGSSPVSVSASVAGLTPNTIYHYRLDATNAHGTNDNSQDQTFTTSPSLPMVNDQPPSVSNITQSSVLLLGTVNPEHSETTYHFIYGTTGTYGSSTLDLHAGSGLGDQPLPGAFLGGLASGTTYHYALVASNLAGTVTGPDYTFTTSPLMPPIVAATGVSSVTQSTANLSGTIDTRGLQTSAYGFDLGVNTSYTSSFVLDNANAGVGPVSAQTITVDVSNLQPGTTYHYRVFATNADGTSYSPNQTFTTPGSPPPPAFTNLLTGLTAPLLGPTPAITFPTDTKNTAIPTPKPTKCNKGFVKKHGKCVKQKKPKRKRKK